MSNQKEREKSKSKLKFYTISQMGSHVSKDPPMIHLSETFLTKKLGISQITLSFDSTIKESANIGCPCCKQGHLQLFEAKPIYEGGMFSGPVPETKKHTADDYNFKCSNQKCPATFYGSYRWMYID